MAHANTRYRRRVAFSVVTVGASGTADVELAPPAAFAEFWDAIDTDGYGIRLAASDGVTALTYAWSGFNKSAKTGTIQIDGVTVPLAADRCVLLWLYYDADSPTDGSSAVTISSPLTGVLDMARPDPGATVPVRQQAPGSTSPAASLGKSTVDELYVWLDLGDIVQRVAMPYNGRLNWEEPAVAEVAVLDSSGVVVGSMTDAADMRWVSVREGQRDRILLKLRVKAGTDAVNYTLAAKFYTSTPDVLVYRTIDSRVGVSVRDLLSDGALTTAPLGTTGWASYEDTTHTSGSPQALTGGTRAEWTNDGSTANETYSPGGATLWGSDRITPSALGESYVVRVDFTINPGTAGGAVKLDVDVGSAPFSGTSDVIIEGSQLLALGSAIQSVSWTFQTSCLSSMLANGAAIGIVSSVAADVYDKKITISRIH